MNRQEVMDTLVGEMFDMISCFSIYHGTAEQASNKSYDEIMAMD